MSFNIDRMSPKFSQQTIFTQNLRHILNLGLFFVPCHATVQSRRDQLYFLLFLFSFAILFLVSVVATGRVAAR